MDKNFDNKIYNLVEHRKTLWTALIVLTGGLAGLILSMSEFSFNAFGVIKLILLMIGFAFLYVLFIGVLQIGSELSKLLK